MDVNHSSVKNIQQNNNTSGESGNSLFWGQLFLMDVGWDRIEIARRGRVIRIGHLVAPDTPLIHLSTNVPHQVTEMSGLLHYWT